MDASTRQRLVVALDGPGSSGKSSVGAAAALEVGYRFCDTGLLYRAVTWLALARNVSASYPHAMRGLVDEVELAPDAAGPAVARPRRRRRPHRRRPQPGGRRRRLGRRPRSRSCAPRSWSGSAQLADGGGIVMAGRDIGTVVLPDADLKIFLEASVEERARRRTEERGLDPDGPEADAILEALRRRDELDSTRAVAPLRAADGRPDHLDRRQPLRGHGRRGRQRDPRRRGAPGRRARAERRRRRSTAATTRTPIESSITPLITTS